MQRGICRLELDPSSHGSEDEQDVSMQDLTLALCALASNNSTISEWTRSLVFVGMYFEFFRRRGKCWITDLMICFRSGPKRHSLSPITGFDPFGTGSTTMPPGARNLKSLPCPVTASQPYFSASVAHLARSSTSIPK